MCNQAGGSKQGTDCFPLFIPLEGRAVLVIGGGHIALRRIRALLSFGARIQVIAPALCEELATLAAAGKITHQNRPYRNGDCAGAFLVLAATDCRAANHAVARECAAAGIPVNVCDCPQECAFFFPGVAKEGPVSAGIIAGGTDHRLARRLSERLRAALSHWIAEEKER